MTTESIPTRLLVWHEQTDPTKLLRITDAIRRGGSPSPHRGHGDRPQIPRPRRCAPGPSPPVLPSIGDPSPPPQPPPQRGSTRLEPLHTPRCSSETGSPTPPRGRSRSGGNRPARGAPSGGDRFTTTARHLSRLPPDRASCLRAWNQTSRPGVLQRSDDRRRHHDLAPAERGHVVGHRQQSRTPARNCDPVRPDPPARRHRGFRDDTRHLRRVTTRANSAPPLDEGQPRGRCSCSGRDSIRDQ